MKRVYKTALGKPIDLDGLRVANEQTIAVGNMKVNARGDELGPGGTVMKARNQNMDSYYKLNTPSVVAQPDVAMVKSAENKQKVAGARISPGKVGSTAKPTQNEGIDQDMSNQDKQPPINDGSDFESFDNEDAASAEEAQEETSPVASVRPTATTQKPNMRGSLADAIAKKATVKQELMTPPNKKSGPQRI